MANEYEVKTSDAAGLSGTESPVESPVEVPVLSFVYIISCEGRTKIGLADDVERRRGGIEKAIGIAVELHGSRGFLSRNTAGVVERQLHARFADSRLLGEWFRATPTEALAALAAVVPPAEAPPRPDVPVDYDYAEETSKRALAHLESLIERGRKRKKKKPQAA